MQFYMSSEETLEVQRGLKRGWQETDEIAVD